MSKYQNIESKQLENVENISNKGIKRFENYLFRFRLAGSWKNINKVLTWKINAVELCFRYFGYHFGIGNQVKWML